MKRLVLGLVSGFILLLAFVISLAPANVVLPWFTSGFSTVSLNNPTGTVWNSSLDSVSYQGRSIQKVSIDISFWHLLLGNLSSDIRIDDQNLLLDGAIKLNKQQIAIEDMRYQLEADTILDWVKLPITELSGRFIGEVMSITVNPNELKALDAHGYWQNAVIGYPNSTLELGDIHFTVTRTDNGRALLTITENPGMLDLKGTLEVGFDKQYQLNVSTQTDVPSHIKQWLTQLGRVENNRILIKWNGRLP